MRSYPAKNGSVFDRPVIGDTVERPRVGRPTLPLMAGQSMYGNKRYEFYTTEL